MSKKSGKNRDKKVRLVCKGDPGNGGEFSLTVGGEPLPLAITKLSFEIEVNKPSKVTLEVLLPDDTEMDVEPEDLYCDN